MEWFSLLLSKLFEYFDKFCKFPLKLAIGLLNLIPIPFVKICKNKTFLAKMEQWNGVEQSIPKSFCILTPDRIHAGHFLVAVIRGEYQKFKIHDVEEFLDGKGFPIDYDKKERGLVRAISYEALEKIKEDCKILRL